MRLPFQLTYPRPVHDAWYPIDKETGESQLDFLLLVTALFLRSKDIQLFLLFPIFPLLLALLRESQLIQAYSNSPCSKFPSSPCSVKRKKYCYETAFPRARVGTRVGGRAIFFRGGCVTETEDRFSARRGWHDDL